MSPRTPPPGTSDPLAAKVYRRGLLLFPKAHRERFGPEMEQLFRDLWRDTRASGSPAAVVALVLRTTTDLLFSACRERLVSLRQPMNVQRMNSRQRLGWSLGAGIPVTAAILGLAIVVTLAIPKTYRSTVRVLLRYTVDPSATRPPGADPFVLEREMEIARSAEVSSRAIQTLSSNERWSRRYRQAETSLTSDALRMLRRQVSVRSVRNTSLLEITVHDADRQLAADIANAIAEAYLGLPGRSVGTSDASSRPTTAAATPPQPPVDGSRIGLSVIDLAEPGLRPVHPNVPLNLFVGLMSGLVAGSCTAVLVWLYLRRKARTLAPASTAPVH